MCTSDAYTLMLTGTPGCGSRSIKLNGNLSITSLSFGSSLGGLVDFKYTFSKVVSDLSH